MPLILISMLGGGAQNVGGKAGNKDENGPDAMRGWQLAGNWLRIISIVIVGFFHCIGY